MTRAHETYGRVHAFKHNTHTHTEKESICWPREQAHRRHETRELMMWGSGNTPFRSSISSHQRTPIRHIHTHARRLVRLWNVVWVCAIECIRQSSPRCTQRNTQTHSHTAHGRSCNPFLAHGKILRVAQRSCGKRLMRRSRS